MLDHCKIQPVSTRHRNSLYWYFAALLPPLLGLKNKRTLKSYIKMFIPHAVPSRCGRWTPPRRLPFLPSSAALLLLSVVPPVTEVVGAAVNHLRAVSPVITLLRLCPVPVWPGPHSPDLGGRQSAVGLWAPLLPLLTVSRARTEDNFKDKQAVKWK